MINIAVYACADLHGRYDLYEKIKAFIKPDDAVFFLGDAGDRGPQSWETIKAICNDPQFIYLKGNHEDMLVKAGEEYIGLRDGSVNRRDLERNGGRDTFNDMIKEPNFTSWINYIRNLPKIDVYCSEVLNLEFVLTHAGFTPGIGLENRGEVDFLWNRDHFYDNWPTWNENFNNVIIVHGHTPIGLMDEIVLEAYGYKEDEPGAFWYCGNHKVNLDVGAVWNDYTVLLNLDTLDEEIIY
ncbi:MAG: hypothetical protein IKB70_07680 [Bacilli bacterium]|nr:hypothetical protein [Bacilli bacterium]